MCGIVGFFGHQGDILPTLINGLKRLEYRGYDSAGIAIVTAQKDLYIQKTVGRVAALEEAVKQSSLPEFDGVGIAHTRWATHGIPSTVNAHPHQSYDGKIAVVHNGIIENFKQLKEELMSQGVEFVSQTDTEVIAHTIAKHYHGNLKEAVLQSLQHFEGAFAIAVISADEPNRMIGAKLGGPLVLGIAENNEFVLASDVSAIISKTRQVIYLEDGEMVDINQGNYSIVNFNDETLAKDIHTVDWDDEAATKGGYEHFMLKEMMEQPKAMEDSCRGRLILDNGTIHFGGLLDIQEKLHSIDRVVLLAIGGASFSARLGELFFENIAGIPAKAVLSPEFRYSNPALDEKTWVIAVSQSGETADTIAAIQEAKRKGALVTGIVNVVGSTISRITDAGVYNHIGPEIGVASTKATTSQYLILLMHAILLGRMRGLGLSDSQEFIRAIQELPKQVQKVLDQNDEIRTLAQKYVDYKNFAYMGRKYNYPASMEGAIKLKEISYIHAEAFSGGELKHGPIAMIEPDFPTVALANKNSLYEKMVSNIQEVKARSGKVIALATEGDTHIAELVDDALYVPAVIEELEPIVNVVAMQLFAYHVAELRGLDVDKPRNLAKSVVVE